MSQQQQNGSLIRLSQIHKTYNEGTSAAFEALKGIDLIIDRGDFVSIMGPSGSGKSTLMNLLGCLDQPTSGNYFYEGISVHELDSYQRSLLRRYALGFVFQGFNLLARTSAIENVELPLLYRGIKRRERKRLAREALASVGLDDKEKNTPAELSGGQQQRVAIARALVANPSTLFADEPTGNLDTQTTHEIMKLLAKLNDDRGITILMVTHEQSVASFAKRTVSVRDGLIDFDRRHVEAGTIQGRIFEC